MRVTPSIALAVLALALAGCVERILLIRSEPAGAPVYIDETYAGSTPAAVPFTHYGVRRVRVGPVRDEPDNLVYAEQERVVRVEAPWYEVFPIDFFAEVLWPAAVRDVHTVSFRLQPPEAGSIGEPAAREALSRAEAYRSASIPVPPASASSE
jgi:hypothetical protein